MLRNNDFITLNFPAKNIETCSLPLLTQGLGLKPKEVYQYDNERSLAVYDTEEEIRQLTPNFSALKELAHRGIIVTAPGNKVDFVSRTFYPQKIIPEDHVTGASHCLLVSYWSKKLNKAILQAQQVSKRGGEIVCEYQNDRVLISGKAVLYMQGIILALN